MRLYTAEEMSRADNGAQKLGIPGGVLMERAGVEMARVALEAFAPGRALVVAGGGNNGGDGFVIARELHRAGVEVSVLPTKDEYRGDALINLEILRNLDVGFVGPDELEAELPGTNLVVDALLGTGFSGEVREKEARLIEKMNESAAPVLAVDVPSGVNGATGEVAGAAVRADVTVCAHAAKAGCVISPGLEHAGEVVAVDIGIPPEADVSSSLAWTDADGPARQGPSHRRAGPQVLGRGPAGRRGLAPARPARPQMVVRGAERTGCGIVFLATSEGSAPSVDLELTEALVHGVPEYDGGYMTSAALSGSWSSPRELRRSRSDRGWASGTRAARLVEGILREVEAPVLLDADAVTNLAGTEALARRDAPTVITPHAGELGRLLESDAKEVEAHRLASARSAAETHGCCVLLKGSDTLVVRGIERLGQLDRVAWRSRPGGRGTCSLASSGPCSRAGWTLTRRPGPGRGRTGGRPSSGSRTPDGPRRA